MSERRLLQVIAALLAAQLVVQVVPGPFVHCERRDTGLTEEILEGFPQSVSVTECIDTWWPIGSDAVGWIPPAAPEPRPTLRPGETPLAP